MTKPSSNTLWFKRRRYGYGWTPVTWQGWIAVGLFLAVILGGAALAIDAQSDVATVIYLNFVIASALLLIGVSLQKGPLPKWRWGKSSSDNPEEDY